VLFHCYTGVSDRVPLYLRLVYATTPLASKTLDSDTYVERFVISRTLPLYEDLNLTVVSIDAKLV
jgi:hypothetical protein